MTQVFHVNDDMLVILAEVMGAHGGEDAVFALLEWIAEFEERNGRPASATDFHNENPPLVYRGIYEDQETEMILGTQDARTS